jgi:hypothetical protein
MPGLLITIPKLIIMKNALSIFVLLIAVISTGFSPEGAWVIDRDSKLIIHGATNINTFTCRMESFASHDTLYYYENSLPSKIEFERNSIYVPIQNFDCGSRQVSKDFSKTLKSDTYPNLEITFISLQILRQGASQVTGVVDISLAGETSRYDIKFSMKEQKKVVSLVGNHPVKFADFELKAPKKFNGLVRVNEVLNVEFRLRLKPIRKNTVESDGPNGT